MIFEDFTTKPTKRRHTVPCKVTSVGGGPGSIVVWINETEWPPGMFNFGGVPPLVPRGAELILTREEGFALLDMLKKRLEYP